MYRYETEAVSATVIPAYIRDRLFRVPNMDASFVWQCTYLVHNKSGDDVRLDQVRLSTSSGFSPKPRDLSFPPFFLRGPSLFLWVLGRAPRVWWVLVCAAGGAAFHSSS